MNNGFNFYRIKTQWQGEAEDGSLSKRKTEELVYASSYTEAETVANEIIRDQGRDKFSDDLSVEIVKTKINELILNDVIVKDSALVSGLICSYFEESEETGVGLYGVKVMFIEIDEKTAKEKRRHETIYTPAKSNADATERVQKYLEGSMSDYVVRDVKFDKTEAILLPPERYEQLTSLADQCQ